MVPNQSSSSAGRAPSRQQRAVAMTKKPSPRKSRFVNPVSQGRSLYCGPNRRRSAAVESR